MVREREIGRGGDRDQPLRASAAAHEVSTRESCDRVSPVQ